jgi:SAM-dependent methyltransferase
MSIDPERVIWHDVECGGYEADLPLWEELATERGGPILELGCGTGRVVIHLARATGELVIGLDRDDELVGAIWDRAKGVEGDAEFGDVRGFDLHARFELVLAPMQLIQLLPERTDRVCCLSCVADHLEPGGRAAFAIVEELQSLPEGEAAPPIPDVRQVGDWVYSSLPMPPEVREDAIVLRRLRQTVAPDGKLSEEEDEVVLQTLSAETLEQEAKEMGLFPIGRREIPATDAHVGSTVVLLEAP